MSNEEKIFLGGKIWQNHVRGEGYRKQRIIFPRPNRVRGVEASLRYFDFIIAYGNQRQYVV